MNTTDRSFCWLRCGRWLPVLWQLVVVIVVTTCSLLHGGELVPGSLSAQDQPACSHAGAINHFDTDRQSCGSSRHVLLAAASALVSLSRV